MAPAIFVRSTLTTITPFFFNLFFPGLMARSEVNVGRFFSFDLSMETIIEPEAAGLRDDCFFLGLSAESVLDSL